MFSRGYPTCSKYFRMKYQFPELVSPIPGDKLHESEGGKTKEKVQNLKTDFQTEIEITSKGIKTKEPVVEKED